MATIRLLLRDRGADPSEISGGILSSVVPELRNVIKDAMKILTGRTFLCVGAGLKTGLDIRMDNPAQLGADLVVDAVAALSKYKPPLVIFDMGTATTMSVIDENGAFQPGRPSCHLSTWASRSTLSAATPSTVCSPGRCTAAH